MQRDRKGFMGKEDRMGRPQSDDGSADYSPGQFRRVSGSGSDEFGEVLAHQVGESLWFPADATKEQKVRQVSAALAAMRGIEPRDEIEGMLAAQMVAAHAAAMECYRRSMIPGQGFESRQVALKQAANMSRLYADQVQALAKYRGKGQQLVRVERVNITADKAIVGGTISHSVGEGHPAKSGGQPHAVEYAPRDQMPCEITPVGPAVPRAGGQGLARVSDARRGRRCP